MNEEAERFAPVMYTGTVSGEVTTVSMMGSGTIRARPHVFELIESALESRGLPDDALYGDPDTLRTLLVEEVFDSPPSES